MRIKDFPMWFKVLVLAALGTVLIFGAAACGGGDGEAEKGPIVFGEQSWGSYMFQTRVARYIIENGYGIETEGMPGETVTVWTGLTEGDIDVMTEVWPENQKDLWEEGLKNETVVDLGVLFPDSVQGFFVPAYVVEGDPERGIEPMAPDLESVEDLPEYWELFKDPEDPSKGRIYNGIAGWEAERINQQKLEVYGLDETYNAFNPGTTAALFGSLDAAYKKGEPWVGYCWSPTWIFGKLDLIQVEEPEYDPEVWDKNRGCAYPEVETHVAVTKTFPEKYPEVTEFLKNFSTTSELVSEALAYMRDNNVEADAAAIHFLEEREDVWTEWVPEEVAVKVKDSLK